MNRRNRLGRAALVLALLMRAAIVTGVAESATKTAIPKQLTALWHQHNNVKRSMVVGSRGTVVIRNAGDLTTAGVSYNANFSHVTAHRLRISGIPSCSGTGTYRWTATFGSVGMNRVYTLRLRKIHDACKARVRLFAADLWWRY